VYILCVLVGVVKKCLKQRARCNSEKYPNVVISDSTFVSDKLKVCEISA